MACSSIPAWGDTGTCDHVDCSHRHVLSTSAGVRLESTESISAATPAAHGAASEVPLANTSSVLLMDPKTFQSPALVPRRESMIVADFIQEEEGGSTFLQVFSRIPRSCLEERTVRSRGSDFAVLEFVHPTSAACPFTIWFGRNDLRHRAFVFWGIETENSESRSASADFLELLDFEDVSRLTEGDDLWCWLTSLITEPVTHLHHHVKGHLSCVEYSWNHESARGPRLYRGRVLDRFRTRPSVVKTYRSWVA